MAQAAGWYGDPDGGGGQRWWDGSTWTGATRVPMLVDGAQYREVVKLLTDIKNAVWVLAGLAILGVIGAVLAGMVASA